MELKEELIDKVERYLSGELTRKEVKEETHLELSGEELDEAIELFETSRSLIELNGLREDLQSIHQEYIAETVQPKSNTRWIWLTVAMAAVALFFAIYSGLFTNQAPVFEDYFTAYPDLVSMRGSEGDINEAMRLYSLGNYQAALTEFGEIPRSYRQPGENLNKDLLFYEGIAALAAANYVLARKNLQALSTAENNTYWQQTRWYLALTLWQSGNVAEARELLSAIEERQYGYKEAQELLESL